MDENYQNPVCNCVRNNCCHSGYECCSQDVPDGTPTFGLCVKKGRCNPKLGLVPKLDFEGYDENSCACKGRKWEYWIAIPLILTLLLLVFLMVRKK